LDAIAFIWKSSGTGCIHLPEAHWIIQLMRDVLDMVAPHVVLITETNVPHAENISYFGDGSNEAQLVYNFALPPLILHTLHTGNAQTLTQWAASLERFSDKTTYFNFTASHDGIGVRPVTGILSAAEIAALVERTVAHGGRVSYRAMPDGSQSPYELNITYFDAITHPHITQTQPEIAVQRFLVSQAIMLAIVGLPGIYFHSLVGSRNFYDGVAQTGHNRTINREKLDADALIAELETENSLREQVYRRYTQLLKIRTSQSAFHALGKQQIHDLHPGIFAVERSAPDNSQRLVALHNVTDAPITVDISQFRAQAYHDLLTDISYAAPTFTLAPYQIAWLTLR
jgi:sucrose phosphorylase